MRGKHPPKRNPLGAAVIIAAIGAMLCACATPNANLARAIDIRLYDSDEQRLIVHNALPQPIEILKGRNGRAETLAPNATMEIRFRVVSLESHLRVADQAYYFHTAGPVTNRFEEMDGMNFVDSTATGAVLYYRDSFGAGEFAIDLDECPQHHWETKQWGSAAHRIEFPSRADGMSQPICPAP